MPKSYQLEAGEITASSLLSPSQNHYLKAISRYIPSLSLLFATLADYQQSSWLDIVMLTPQSSIRVCEPSLTVSSTLSWSASFYPQPLLNFRRRSTHGTTPAFPTLNVLGFLCYTTSTVLFYYSPLIQSQYRSRNNGEENTVRANDVAFAVHALILCVLTLSQFSHSFWGFEKRKVRLGKGVWGIVVGSVAGIALVIGMVLSMGLDGGRDAGSWAWIDVVSIYGS